MLSYLTTLWTEGAHGRGGVPHASAWTAVTDVPDLLQEWALYGTTTTGKPRTQKRNTDLGKSRGIRDTGTGSVPVGALGGLGGKEGYYLLTYLLTPADDRRRFVISSVAVPSLAEPARRGARHRVAAAVASSVAGSA